MFKIGKKQIGMNSPCFIIAEAGANFKISNNPKKNFKQALKLIDIAAEAGADAIKFQLYTSKRLYVQGAGKANYIGKNKSINKIIKEMELPTKWLPKLKKRSEEKGLEFLCTPFDETAADQLEKIGIHAFKIASYSINHIPLIRHIAKKGKPMIVSVGASNMKDISKAIQTIRNEGNSKIVLLQCTAKYPAPLSTINLNTIPTLQDWFQLNVGLSDHSKQPLIAPLGAIALGAKIIEKHFTTNKKLPGPDHKFAINPKQLKQMVTKIRQMEQTLGKSWKIVLKEEQELHTFCRRSIFAVKNIKKGEVFSKQNIAVLRPGKKEKGLEPEMFQYVLGTKPIKEIKKGQPIKRSDLINGSDLNGKL